MMILYFHYHTFCRYSIAEANSSQGLMNTLTISSLTRDDGGDYSCIASNKYGSSSLRVHLSVFGKFESFEEKKNKYPIVESLVSYGGSFSTAMILNDRWGRRSRLIT